MNTVPEKTKKKLTIKENRLAGHDSCQNCGTELQGPYCHYCGQPDKNFFRFFPALLREMMGDFLDFDSRLTRTLKPLLFQPGKLASDYMHGRRFRYTSPVRLYMFSSIVFFVLASLMTNLSIHDQILAHKAGNQEATISSKAELVGIQPETSPEIVNPEVADSETDASSQDKSNIKESKKHKDDIIKIGLDIDADGNGSDRVDVSFFPKKLNNWINAELAKSDSKAKAISDDPSVMVSKVFDMLPMTVFLLLPVFALLLKLLYIFSKRYYTEHLIFALYTHSFVFTLATIVLLINATILFLAFMGWLDKTNNNTENLANASQILLLWIPLYLWLALKRFYQQGWFRTTLKFGALGISYLILLAVVTTLITVIGFLLL